MANYTYVGNVERGDNTSVISLRSGAIQLAKGQYADLTTQEVALLSGRFRLVAGTTGSTGPATPQSPLSISGGSGFIQDTKPQPSAGQKAVWFDPSSSSISLVDDQGNVTPFTSSSSGGAASLTPTAIKTANYALVAGDLARFDTSGGTALTATLPDAPPNKTQIGVKLSVTDLAHNVTVTRSGTDVINLAGGSTSFDLKLANQLVVLQYESSTKIWHIIESSLSLSQLDARFISLAQIAAATSWSSGTAYTPGMAARTIQGVYVALVSNTGVNPDTQGDQTWYFLFANGQKGDNGVAGVDNRVALPANISGAISLDAGGKNATQFYRSTTSGSGVLTGDIVLSVANLSAGADFIAHFKQDATGGRRITISGASAPIAFFNSGPGAEVTIYGISMDGTLVLAWEAGNGLPTRAPQTLTYSPTITPNVDTTDVLNIGPITGALTLANPTGTPTDGLRLRVRYLQDGTGTRAITHGSAFLPSDTVPYSSISTASGKETEALYVYRSRISKWVLTSAVVV